ncbi:uncharacterized protein LOC129295076 isoform X1 [Prosopis cineraria]|uniref:uncharacterized protein LOC129295076 isoform X1 n=1 Tax=Prosopis cineraria TaxID=364024 RepID=UPI0024105E42|nr:uncharacterized protein LOC129295076 isoform X1 [Prosopis cineraria]
METSKKEIVIKRADDHWAFLEHIEAPMWADLTLEAKSGGEDINDDWFSESHLFHQWSSHQLKSKFSKSGEEIVASELDSQGPPSPEHPSSVSRSRGKHYGSMKWGINLDVLFDKQLPAMGFSRRCFQKVSGFGPEVKSKAYEIKSKGTSSAKLGLVSECNASRKTLSNCTKSMATRRSLVNRPGSMENKTGGSNSRSTVTSEYTQRQENLTEVSSKPYGQKSQLSFRNSTSVRKSCAVEKASRVDINGDSKKSRARKSSHGKSSVGSCSNTVPDGKEVAFLNPESRSRYKLPNISRKSTVHIEEPKLLDRLGTAVEFAKPSCHKATKSLFHRQIVRSRARLAANKQNSSASATMEQVENGKLNGLAGERNENTASSASYVAVHRKSSTRDVPAGGPPTDQRITERNILQKSTRAGLAALQMERLRMMLKMLPICPEGSTLDKVRATYYDPAYGAI